VIALAIIVASLLATFGFGGVLALALGRIAASADQDSERLLSEKLLTAPIGVYRQGYAGWAAAQSTIALESSITDPSSRTSAGTQRSPVSS
jgi:hypothetical protein